MPCYNRLQRERCYSWTPFAASLGVNFCVLISCRAIYWRCFKQGEGGGRTGETWAFGPTDFYGYGTASLQTWSISAGMRVSPSKYWFKVLWAISLTPLTSCTVPVFHDPCFLIEFGGGNLLGLLLFANATDYITLYNCAWKGLFVHTFRADTSDEKFTTWVFSADPSSGGFWAKRKGAQREVGARGQLEFMGAVPFKDGVCISVICEYLMVQVNSSHL